METAMEEPTGTRSFPRDLSEPEVETVLFSGSPWSVRITAFNSSNNLLSSYPEISVSVLYAATAYIVCTQNLEGTVGKKATESSKMTFLRAVRAQARSYLEVLSSEDAARVWQEEEINSILKQ
jgi:hypothetical protein